MMRNLDPLVSFQSLKEEKLRQGIDKGSIHEDLKAQISPLIFIERYVRVGYIEYKLQTVQTAF